MEELDWHNKLTALTQFALNLAIYYVLPGYVSPWLTLCALFSTVSTALLLTCICSG